ncbi:type 1 fimbrial protein [Klebsiella michiganensis]|uniref:fimbrial protein n=1 Tax=Klebsiella michiganensis TaxID=1134687 RepID=UPI002DB74B8C|nr:fimbrial protein [Klebsiella michiganensis]MEB8290185.1 type 1 fimbrial protein [Klebsiella michiganensis]
MRNYKYAVSALALLVTSAFTTSALAVDGTITINGKITDTTCTISVDGGSKDATVTLPTVSASTLSANGQTAGATPFKISLSDCSGTSMNTASTYFEPGAYVDNVTGRLNIDTTASDAATNVQVELLNAERNAIVAGASVANGQNDIPVDISGGSGTLNYFAQYHATGAAGAGSVTTQVDYTMVYE